MGTTENISTFLSWYNESRILLWGLEDDIDDRLISQYNAGWHGGIGHVVVSLRAVMYDLIEAMQWSIYGLSSSFNYTYLPNILSDLNAKTFDWIDVMDAYLDTDDERRQGWLLLTDAFKASMYNKPFNMEYHQFYVRQFQAWR